MSIKILEVEKIEAETTELFMAMFNERANELARFNPTVCPINSTSALIYHESIETADRTHAEEQRCCAECSLYEWGKYCLIDYKHKDLKCPACEHFTDDDTARTLLFSMNH